jgi:lipoprotein-releasing system ATP-binding protein
MSDCVLSIRGLVREYTTLSGTLSILRGVDLDVKSGEIVGLVGPSGSGKSSLLHAAGLLERPTAGAITIAGQDCTALADRDRTAVRRNTLGFVYQFHNLLPEFDALDNVALPARIAGASLTEARERAGPLLGMVGLSERLHHQPAELSGGEQQRVAIARALVNDPRLVIADEPTGNLDPGTSELVFGQLFELSRNKGVSLLVATHNLSLVRFMDRVLTVRDGVLVPLEVAGDPSPAP